MSPFSVPQLPEVEIEPEAAVEPEQPCGGWRVLLYNDQVHTFAQVIALLAAATGFDLPRCAKITLEVHVAGRAEVTRTDVAEAERIVGILSGGGLLAAMRPA